MAIPDLLKGCPLFFELYDTEIETIVERCSVITFHPGETIVKDGEEGNEIFVVLSGEASIQKKEGDRVIHILNLKKGDVFGEVVLFDEKKRSADIIAEEECCILEIQYDQIFRLFQKEPRIFGLLVLNLSRLLALRIRVANQKIMTLANRK